MDGRMRNDTLHYIPFTYTNNGVEYDRCRIQLSDGIIDNVDHPFFNFLLDKPLSAAIEWEKNRKAEVEIDYSKNLEKIVKAKDKVDEHSKLWYMWHSEEQREMEAEERGDMERYNRLAYAQGWEIE